MCMFNVLSCNFIYVLYVVFLAISKANKESIALVSKYIGLVK